MLEYFIINHIGDISSSSLKQFLLLAINLPYLPTGVDFKVKHVIVGGKKLKLAIWDTGKSICWHTVGKRLGMLYYV